MYCQKATLIVNLILLLLTSPVFAQPNWCPDLSADDFVNFGDFAVFANNWQKSGVGLVGDFDDSGTVDIYDLTYFAYFWLGDYECKNADFNLDYKINFLDYAKLANAWLTDVNNTNWDAECDLDYSEYIDLNDLRILCQRWLRTYPTPTDAFEAFKSALAAGDIDEAVTYFADFVADDYRNIFNENTDKLQNMVNNMGDLSLEYRDRDIAVYEISNIAGTKFYPVIFIQADDGSWKIAVF